MAYPTLAYYERLKTNPVIRRQFNNNISAVTYDTLRRQVLSLNIYYDELIYTIISEDYKMEVLDLIGAVGGTLGLFAGVSFLSFFEVLELAVKLIQTLISKRKSNKKIADKSIS